ncbi:S24 family peptidase [Sphingobium aromaticiconvertens]|uniref:S24 family peptidase n=1 Tax=Sphingobium aromaticiconvertens TaxID=365341 RepID=UPI003015AD44
MSNEKAIDILKVRLAAAIKHRNTSPKALARTAGIGETVVRDILQDTTQDVRLGTVEKLAKALGLSVSDLLPDAFGRVAQRADESEDDVEIQEWDVSYGMGAGAYLDLPVKGNPRRFSREWISQFTHSPASKLFFASGTGDSMMPTILDADIVLIDTSEREVRMGDRIWAIAIGDVGYIKRLRPMADGTVAILSDNPNVPADRASDGDMSVVGRVVAIVRKT